MNQRIVSAAALSTVVALAALAGAQDSSLMLAPVPEVLPDTATMQNSSFIFQTLPPEAVIRPLEKESIITVLVDYRSIMQSDGSGETRRTGTYNLQLQNWLAFDGKDLFRAPQRRGDPTIQGQLNSQYRAESDLEQSESLTFPIAAKVADIRPNGNLVIEGRRRIRINEEVWNTFLTGTVPRQAIGPDWTVRDTMIDGLRIEKYEEGAVRDGYARGWLGRWYGKTKAL
ncbi:MAG: flagellar basal body L-ring protein FlgH [Lacipirellulaceae bacterium]